MMKMMKRIALWCLLLLASVGGAQADNVVANLESNYSDANRSDYLKIDAGAVDTNIELVKNGGGIFQSQTVGLPNGCIDPDYKRYCKFKWWTGNTFGRDHFQLYLFKDITGSRLTGYESFGIAFAPQSSEASYYIIFHTTNNEEIYTQVDVTSTNYEFEFKFTDAIFAHSRGAAQDQVFETGGASLGNVDEIYVKNVTVGGSSEAPKYLCLRSAYYYKTATAVRDLFEGTGVSSGFDPETGLMTIPFSAFQPYLHVEYSTWKPDHMGTLTIGSDGTITATPNSLDEEVDYGQDPFDKNTKPTSTPTKKRKYRLEAKMVLDVSGLDFTCVRRIQFAQTGGNNGYQGKKADGTNGSSAFFGRMRITDVTGETINPYDATGNFWNSMYNLNYVNFQDFSKKMGRIEWMYEPTDEVDYWSYENGDYVLRGGKDVGFQDNQTYTMNFYEFSIQYDVIHSDDYREVPVTSIHYNKYENGVAVEDQVFLNNYRQGLKLVNPGEKVYGDWWFRQEYYADLSDYDEIRVTMNPDTKVQAVFNIDQTGKSFTVPAQTRRTVDGTAYAYVNLATAKATATEKGCTGILHFNGIELCNTQEEIDDAKLNSNAKTDLRVWNVSFFKKNNPIDYYISGKFYKGQTQNQSVINALTAFDKNTAMNIDAMGLRVNEETLAGITQYEADKLSLNTSNSNCLVYIPYSIKDWVTKKVYSRPGGGVETSGSNTNLVTTNDGGATWQCENLHITDRMFPFRAARPFTATNVFFVKDFTAASLNESVSFNTYTTLCLPFDYTYDNSWPAKAYVTSTTEKGSVRGQYQLNLTEVTGKTIPANTPVILAMNTKETDTAIPFNLWNANKAIPVTPSSLENGMLHATYLGVQPTPDENGDYAFMDKFYLTPGMYAYQNQPGLDGRAFYPVVRDNYTFIRAFRCYMAWDGPAEANSIVLNFIGDEEPPTALRGVTDAEPLSIVSRYDGMGRRISAPVKGMNVLRMSDGTTRKVMIP